MCARAHCLIFSELNFPLYLRTCPCSVFTLVRVYLPHLLQHVHRNQRLACYPSIGFGLPCNSRLNKQVLGHAICLTEQTGLKSSSAFVWQRGKAGKSGYGCGSRRYITGGASRKDHHHHPHHRRRRRHGGHHQTHHNHMESWYKGTIVGEFEHHRANLGTMGTHFRLPYVCSPDMFCYIELLCATILLIIIDSKAAIWIFFFRFSDNLEAGTLGSHKQANWPNCGLVGRGPVVPNLQTNVLWHILPLFLPTLVGKFTVKVPNLLNWGGGWVC